MSSESGYDRLRSPSALCYGVGSRKRGVRIHSWLVSNSANFN